MAAKILNHDSRIPLYSQADMTQAAARTRGAVKSHPRVPGQLWERTAERDSRITRKPLNTFHVVETAHTDCEECLALVPQAEVHAAVTGSTGATYAVEQGTSRHSAKVARNYELVEKKN